MKNKDGAIVFPDVEIVRGTGVGARIRLNDPNFIILSIGVPVRSESIAEDEKSNQSLTMVAATPPNKALQTPAMRDEGRHYLRETIRGVFEGPLQEEDLESSILPMRSVHTAVDRRLLTLFAIVEHMDIGTLSDASDKTQLEEEYNRTLTNYGLNRNLAYRYTKSGMGARGILQITPGTYTQIAELYDDVDIGENHQEATLDPEKSITVAAIKIDDDLKTLRKNTDLTREDYELWKDKNDTDPRIPIALGVLYNAGTGYLRSMKKISKIQTGSLPEETQIYIKKIEYVWGKLHEGRMDTTPRAVVRQSESTKGAPQIVKKYSEKQIRATLKGSRARLKFEKLRAKEVAPRALSFASTEEFIRNGRLLPITDVQYYSTNKEIGREGRASPEEKPMLYCLTPTAKHNLGKIAKIYTDITGAPMHVTSMNRNAAYVKQLRKVNRRATSPSSHEYGTTFDCRRIRDKTQSLRFEQYLLEQQKAGRIIVIKESACYHIFSELRIG